MYLYLLVIFHLNEKTASGLKQRWLTICSRSIWSFVFPRASRRLQAVCLGLRSNSRVSAANEWNIFQHEKRNCISPSGHVMFCLLYKHQWNVKPIAKGAIYHVTIAAVIFPRVKITCYFHLWRYHVFARKLTRYFIGVYIINKVI